MWRMYDFNTKRYNLYVNIKMLQLIFFGLKNIRNYIILFFLCILNLVSFIFFPQWWLHYDLSLNYATIFICLSVSLIAISVSSRFRKYILYKFLREGWETI